MARILHFEAYRKRSTGASKALAELAGANMRKRRTKSDLINNPIGSTFFAVEDPNSGWAWTYLIPPMPGELVASNPNAPSDFLIEVQSRDLSTNY